MACKDKPANLLRSSKGDQRRWRRFQPFVLYQCHIFQLLLTASGLFTSALGSGVTLTRATHPFGLVRSVALGDTSKASNSVRKAFDTLALKQLNFRSLDHVSKRLNVAEFAKSLSIFTGELTLANLSWNPRAAKKKKREKKKFTAIHVTTKKKCLGIIFS